MKIINNAIIMVNLNGGSPTHLTALIRSPNHPKQYPEMSTLLWLVKTLPGYKLTLELYDLDLDPCCGNITLYDGSNRKSSVISILSGTISNKTTTYESVRNAMLVQFESKALTINRRGFSGLFTIERDILNFPRLEIVVGNLDGQAQQVAFLVYLSETLHVISYRFGALEAKENFYLPSKYFCFSFLFRSENLLFLSSLIC